MLVLECWWDIMQFEGNGFSIHFTSTLLGSKPNKLYIIGIFVGILLKFGVEKTPAVRTKGFGCLVNPCDIFNLPNKTFFLHSNFLSCS